ncbi:MAG: DUF423 domain-containing protein [Pseudomonadota bacterium]
MTSAQVFGVVAAIYGASGVALGAFGAHGLESRLGAAGLETWRTAVSYHLFHTLALLAVAVWMRTAGVDGPARGALALAGWCFVAGVLAFSGSLYALALNATAPGGGSSVVRLLGPVTPLGGLAFIAGWLALAWAALRFPVS